jgi:hypothetical protein
MMCAWRKEPRPNSGRKEGGEQLRKPSTQEEKEKEGGKWEEAERCCCLSSDLPVTCSLFVLLRAVLPSAGLALIVGLSSHELAHQHVQILGAAGSGRVAAAQDALSACLLVHELQKVVASATTLVSLAGLVALGGTNRTKTEEKEKEVSNESKRGGEEEKREIKRKE